MLEPEDEIIILFMKLQGDDVELENICQLDVLSDWCKLYCLSHKKDKIMIAFPTCLIMSTFVSYITEHRQLNYVRLKPGLLIWLSLTAVELSRQFWYFWEK